MRRQRQNRYPSGQNFLRRGIFCTVVTRKSRQGTHDGSGTEQQSGCERQYTMTLAIGRAPGSVVDLMGHVDLRCQACLFKRHDEIRADIS